ncbi:MAG: hypothetical protein H7Z72_04840 [Bacteroidetes bacterium]|nr:hypothetical protein [Fibrella sp.]
MEQPTQTDLELLIDLATQADMDYRDAYFVWERVRTHPSAYLIVKAVLCLADKQTLPIEVAFVTWSMWAGRLRVTR